MPKSSPYSRIAITLPERDLAAADRLALALDRSRSWIVAEAIRRYALQTETEAPSAYIEHRAAATSDGAPTATATLPQPGLGPSRLAQLTRDMAMSPEARVRAAEETLRSTEPRDTPRTHRMLPFDRYEDFLDWKRSRDVGR